MVKAQITNNYCWLTLYTQKPEETVRIIVMMWFVNGIPFTFEEVRPNNSAYVGVAYIN